MSKHEASVPSFAREPKRPKRDRIEKRAKPKKISPPHDLLAAPLSVFNWSDSGVLWNEGALGPKDVQIKRQWTELVEKGYIPEPIGISGQTMYFFFRESQEEVYSLGRNFKMNPCTTKTQKEK